MLQRLTGIGARKAAGVAEVLGDGLIHVLRQHAELVSHKVCHVQVEAAVQDLEPQALFELVADPSQHTRIFDSIERCDYQLLSNDGRTVRYAVTYQTRWQFWRMGGVAESRLLMTIDLRAKKVSFKLREPGFLLVYEGSWTFSSGPLPPPAACPKPAGAVLQRQEEQGPSDVAAGAHHADQMSRPSHGGAAPGFSTHIYADFSIEPSNAPPYPINLVLKGQQLNEVKAQMQGLVSAAMTRQQAKQLAMEAQLAA